MVESSFVSLEGTPVKFFYDTVSMMDVEQLLDNLKGPGNHRDFMGMTTPPYDTRELIAMIMFGINGAKRATKDNSLITFKEASEIHQKALEWIGKNSSTNDEVIEKYNTLKNEISIAAKKSVNLFMDSPIV